MEKIAAAITIDEPLTTVDSSTADLPPSECDSIPLDDVLPADSPRLAGEDAEHVQALAELHDELPPILVHRATMRVIDGMHRLKAARLRGADTINVIFYDGDDAGAFILAVQANIRHGLPLSLADRKAAARRIVQSSPHWSDRAIAKVAGLSAKTVGAIRRDAADQLPEVHNRLGCDGRVRPLNTVDGRRYATELIIQQPECSSREIARRAGISPSTVRDVRDRLRRGLDPVPTRRRPNAQTRRSTPESRLQEQIRNAQTGNYACRDDILQRLRRDPAIRLNERGRGVLRWLSWHSAQTDQDWSHLATEMPEHCLDLVADLACSFAYSWLELADTMRQHTWGRS